jgi:CHASE3 domain sensor protein
MCHLITGRQKSARPVPFLLRMAIRSLAFRHGLNRADLQIALIFPARRENFEDLVITARAFVQAMAETSGLSLQAVDDDAYCPRCFTDQGRKLRHALVDCFRSIKTEAAVVTGKRNTLLWMWNAFAVICVGFMLMLVPLPTQSCTSS